MNFSQTNNNAGDVNNGGLAGGYAEAWRRILAVHDNKAKTLIDVLDEIEVCRVIFGDPNAPTPAGVMKAKAKK